MNLHPQYITDNQGNKLSVVLPMNEFKSLMEQLEDTEDVKLFDEAKKEDDGKRISLADYRKKRQLKG